MIDTYTVYFIISLYLGYISLLGHNNRLFVIVLIMAILV